MIEKQTKNNYKRKTILLIDDDVVIRESFSYILEKLGYDSMTAEDGRTGVELFRKEEIDLVMVDLIMPGMDGFQVLSEITKINPNTPLLVISGTKMISDAVQALQNGAWDYLLKPIKNPEILNHAIKNALEKSRLKKEILQYQKHLEQLVEVRTEELKSLLKEKEILIQEIHHRVKNNMSVIISLMSLKSSQLSNTEAKEILRNFENRIRSMALVHEKLYSSNNLKKISAKEYISNLVTEISDNYNDLYTSIDVDYEIDDLYFDLNPLISLGLIINEIITNSIKHAFKDIKKPEISIKLKQKNNDKIELNISDNGAGFSKTDQFSQDNPIGIDIIKMLVDQTDGSLDINSENGTEYNIIMTYPEKSAFQ